MNFVRPLLPDFDALQWRQLPFTERARMVCTSWALDGYGTPLVLFILYALKIAAFVAAWALFCTMSPTLGSIGDVGQWWLQPLAFQKAILWSALFEVLGLGCGSGPLTGRYVPPFGGCLYFLRPGTTKLPLFDGVPLVGGCQRTLLDVVLYVALVVAFIMALVAPTVGGAQLWPIVIVLPLLTVCDKSIFLAARGEHYYVTILLFTLASSQREWIAAAMAVQGALWFFAGVSKFNQHFPSVVAVMMSNSPVMRSAAVRKRMYRAFPDDLRPSRLAIWLAHGGTALELSVPFCLVVGAVLAPGGPWLWGGMALMLVLHTYIVSNVPMGVPLEWNFVVVYGAFALFGRHPDITILDMGPWLAAFVLLVSVLVPLAGNLWPQRISFLPAMRYYAGNWAMSVWLFKGQSYRKLNQRLTMSSAWVDDQLAPFYDEATIKALISKVVAFRLMHLHGRAVGLLLPKAIDGALGDYEWVDGELVAGLVLGWNFGDGHLHNERLLTAVQRQCGFESGELRCIFVESQPLLGDALRYRIHDGCDGLLDSGQVEIATLVTRQPWQYG